MKIDHVELFVPDREQAARWYHTVLGFEVMEEQLEAALGLSAESDACG